MAYIILLIIRYSSKLSTVACSCRERERESSITALLPVHALSAGSNIAVGCTSNARQICNLTLTVPTYVPM